MCVCVCVWVVVVIMGIEEGRTRQESKHTECDCDPVCVTSGKEGRKVRGKGLEEEKGTTQLRSEPESHNLQDFFCSPFFPLLVCFLQKYKRFYLF